MKEKNKGSKLAFVIVLLVLFLVGGFFGGKYYYDTHNKCGVSDKTKETTNEEKEKELDINSRLVQFLYTEVTHDTERNCYAGWEFYSNDEREKDYKFGDANSNEISMNILGQNIGGLVQEYVQSDQAPKVENRRNHKVSYHDGKEYDLGTYSYTKQQVESVYKRIFGSEVKLDTSLTIPLDIFHIEVLYYDSKTDKYYPQYIEGGGTCGPAGYNYKLSKAVKKGNELKIYQDVEFVEYGENGDPTADNIKTNDKFKFVYTYELEDDGMYKFVSRTKEK